MLTNDWKRIKWFFTDPKHKHQLSKERLESLCLFQVHVADDPFQTKQNHTHCIMDYNISPGNTSR